MKKLKKVLPLVMGLSVLCTSIPMVAYADTAKVVTLGTNLTDQQKADMYEYFGTSPEAVTTIEVNNADERKYMEGIASEAQIGTKTYSCAYVEPTTKGGIQVKVANLTFVTSSMIASTLLTSGVENCNVVAACPMAVSGTGALTGIMMAYEEASGEELNEDQKQTATEELITTGELANDIGTEEAADIIAEVKEEVIEKGLDDVDEIAEVIEETAEEHGITLTEDQMAKITDLMEKIAQYDYDVNALKATIDNLTGKSEGFFQSLIAKFTGGGKDGGIINSTNDALLGADAVIDSTLDAVSEKVETAKEDGTFDRIINYFKNLFNLNDAEESE